MPKLFCSVFMAYSFLFLPLFSLSAFGATPNPFDIDEKTNLETSDIKCEHEWIDIRKWLNEDNVEDSWEREGYPEWLKQFFLTVSISQDLFEDNLFICRKCGLLSKRSFRIYDFTTALYREFTIEIQKEGKTYSSQNVSIPDHGDMFYLGGNFNDIQYQVTLQRRRPDELLEYSVNRIVLTNTSNHSSLEVTPFSKIAISDESNSHDAEGTGRLLLKKFTLDNPASDTGDQVYELWISVDPNFNRLAATTEFPIREIYEGKSAISQQPYNKRTMSLADELAKLEASENTPLSEYISLARKAVSELDPVCLLAIEGALGRDKDYVPALRLKVTASFVLGNSPNKTSSLLTQILEKEPNWAEGYAKRGYCFARICEFEKALADCVKAKEAGFSGLVLNTAWGMASFGTGEYKPAQERFQDALVSYRAPADGQQITPVYLEQSAFIEDARLGYGASLLATNQYAKASKYFEELATQQTATRTHMLLWDFVSRLMMDDDEKAKEKLIASAQKLNWTAKNEESEGLLLNAFMFKKEDEIAMYLRTLIEEKAALGGDAAFVCAKWAEATKRERLSEAFLKMAAQQKLGYFFSALLAERALKDNTQKDDANVAPNR